MNEVQVEAEEMPTELTARRQTMHSWRCGEWEMMRELFVDAFDVVRGHFGVTSGALYEAAHLRSTRAWIEGAHAVVTFEMVCTTLDLDESATRKVMLCYLEATELRNAAKYKRAFDECWPVRPNRKRRRTERNVDSAGSS